MSRLLFVLLGLAVAAGAFGQEADARILDRWISRQAEIRTLSASFTQTRALRVLRSPVSASGRFWFRAPGEFRWEVGNPPKTIVLRRGNDVRVIDPGRRTEKVEALELGRREAGMLEFPFVRSRRDLDERFRIVEFRVTDSECLLKLSPRDTEGFLTAVHLAFAPDTGHLHSLELTFRDGSSMRNTFADVAVNEPLPPGIFSFDTEGYRVIDARR